MRLLALALLCVLTALGASAPLSAGPAAADWLTVVARTPEGGTRIGNPAAPLKLVEYGSRTCPTCGRFANESGALRSTYVAGGKVSWEFRDFPVHPQDPGVSLIGMCVSPRNFFKILDQMYAGQDAFNRKASMLTDERLRELSEMPLLQGARAWSDTLGYTDLVRRAGMPEARIAQCFGKPALDALVAVVEGGSKLGVQGTPTFFLNGRQLNAVSWAQIEPYLQ